MADQLHAFPPLDPDRNQVITAFGRKGSGKSVSMRTIFRGWPGVDRLVLDVTGDADPGADMGAVMLPREVPHRLPEPDKDAGPQVYRWIANPHSDTYREDLDNALGLGLFPKERRVFVWVDEGGEVFRANQVGPNGRTALHQGRHYNMSLGIAAPRPMGIDTLCLSQSDRVLMYHIPNPADRERLAAALGIRPKHLSDELNVTHRRGDYWFLMYVADEHQLYRCPPLPQ